MLIETTTVVAFALSAIALVLGVVSLLVHYSKRHEHPVVAPLEAEITTLRLGLIDVVDKLEHFMKRDRTRRARAAVDEDPPESAPGNNPTPQEIKAHLRQIARTPR